MKKIIICLMILVIFSSALTGCSDMITNTGSLYKSKKMNVLKELTLTYQSSDNIVFRDGIPSVVESLDSYFKDDSNKGFLAKIAPIEYIFYWKVTKGNETFYFSGYAECRCSIQKISQKYNLTNYSEEDEIYIRKDVLLDPLNEELLLEIMKKIGGYKNESPVEGTFKVPDEYINASDFKLRIHDATWLLLEDRSYYSFIKFDDNVAHLPLICYSSNEKGADAIGDITFPEFLIKNDPDLLS